MTARFRLATTLYGPSQSSGIDIAGSLSLVVEAAFDDRRPNSEPVLMPPQQHDEAIIRRFMAVVGDASPRAKQMVADHPWLVNAEWQDEPPLHRFATEGNFKAVRLLVDLGFDVRRKDIGQDEPLHNAVLLGETETARVLLDAGASVDEPNGGGWSPLQSAVEHGELEMARLLLERGADIQYDSGLGHTLADSMAECDNPDAFRKLFRQFGHCA